MVTNAQDGASGPRLLPAVLNSFAAILVVAGSVLALRTEPDGVPTAALFGGSRSPLSNDPRAFGIWWAIITGLTVFLVWQWSARGRPSMRLASIVGPALVAGLAQLAWVMTGRRGLITATVALLGLEVVALCLVTWRLAKHRARWLEHLATDTGWGLALGFCCVQLLTSVGIVQESLGKASDEVDLVVAIGAYAVLVMVALGMAGRLYHQFAVGVGLVWGFGWMGWDRLTGEPSSLLLGALAWVGCLAIGTWFCASGVRRRTHVQGLE